MFYQEKEEKDDGMQIDHQYPSQKIKTCYVCKNLKTNHVVREQINQDPDIINDEIKMGVMNIVGRDVIE